MTTAVETRASSPAAAASAPALRPGIDDFLQAAFAALTQKADELEQP
jgi:hypothetical protein